MKVESLRCSSCGAPLWHEDRCDYCGTLLKVEHELSFSDYIQNPSLSEHRYYTTGRIDNLTSMDYGCNYARACFGTPSQDPPQKRSPEPKRHLPWEQK